MSIAFGNPKSLQERNNTKPEGVMETIATPYNTITNHKIYRAPSAYFGGLNGVICHDVKNIEIINVRKKNFVSIFLLSVENLSIK